MDSLSPQVVSATKLPILNPNDFDLWKMRIEQYFLMTDYSLWKVIVNGDSPAPTRVVEGVLQPVAPTTTEQKLARKNELKACECLGDFTSGLTEGKSASTPIDTEKPLLKDPDGEDVDVHTYRSMIGSLMYLTSSRPDIMFACKKQTVVATSSTEVEYVAAVSCCAQVLWIQNQLLDYSDSPLLGVNIPRCDEDRLKLMQLTIFLLPKVKKVGIGVNVVDLQVFAVRHMLLLLVQKLLMFSLTNWCCSLSTVRSSSKGFFGVETPLFKSMLVEHQVDEEEDADENVKEVNAGDAAEGDVSATHGEVPTVIEEPSIPSPTPSTPPPQPSQDIPSTSQVQQTPPQSPQRVETSDETLMDDVSNQGRMIVKVDVDADVVLEDVKEAVDEAKEVVEDAKVDENVDIQGRQAESQAKIYKIDLDHANKVLSMQEDETESAEVQEVVDVITTAKLITKVVTTSSEIITAASVNITAIEAQVPAATTIVTLTVAPARVTAAPSILLLLAELNKNIDWDKVIDHVKLKDKEDPANVASFKMDYFKGMSYDDLRPIFEAKFNSNVAFLLKTKEQIEEDENRALHKLNETLAERGMSYDDLRPIFEAKFNSNVAFLLKTKEQIEEDENRALQKLNETLAERVTKRRYLVKERFSTTKPKNFFDDFLIVTLGGMFEKPDIHAQIWKTQRNVHSPAKRKYPLTRFTLNQMLNAVRLEVEEESEVSLELLRFIRQQHQEGQLE
uniref:Uncharacterized protein n=1 Tax=Tanacetum cinerariifolium TaxID=118510 RepID=A0A6L2LMI0_TANCI|nr:hypothetical protein [Tanacetum cinerariifolium]